MSQCDSAIHRRGDQMLCWHNNGEKNNEIINNIVKANTLDGSNRKQVWTSIFLSAKNFGENYEARVMNNLWRNRTQMQTLFQFSNRKRSTWMINQPQSNLNIATACWLCTRSKQSSLKAFPFQKKIHLSFSQSKQNFLALQGLMVILRWKQARVRLSVLIHRRVMCWEDSIIVILCNDLTLASQCTFLK